MTNYNSLSEKKQIELVQKNGNAIKYIDDPSEAVQLAAVKEYTWSIRYIKNSSEEVQLVAVKENEYAIRWIKNPTKNVIQYCLYECDIADNILLKLLYEKLTSDEDKIYFKMKYGNIVN